MRKIPNDELNRLSPEAFREAGKTPVIFVLDNVRSMLNVGSVFRTADAFRLEALYLCGLTGTPPHREIQKTALGATETVSWKQFESTTEAVAHLRDAGYRVYAVEQAEGSIHPQQLSAGSETKVAFVFGNEVDGVAQEVVNQCHGCVEIPQAGTKHSLNISVCAGIIAWEAWKIFGEK